MAKILKLGISDEAAHDADIKVQQIVAGILEDIRLRGDEAVRDLSVNWKHWKRPISAVVETLAPNTQS